MPVTPAELASYAGRWAGFVAAWKAAGPDTEAGRDLVGRALAGGLASLDLPAAPPPPVGLGRRCEVALVRASGAVDEAGYLAHNPPQADRGAEPVDHFCRRGWRRQRNPSLDFDVWWYVGEHLDPADDSETAINPLVHFLLAGRFQGLSPLPVAVPHEPSELPSHRPVRRAVLYAAYDRDGVIDRTVVDHLRELARHGDVFFFADGELQWAELDKLDGIVRGAWTERHGAHDFGSWSRLARDRVGWSTLQAYDEVVLTNDSCWLVRPLDEVFARMARRTCDVWALQLTARRFEPEPDEPQAVPLDEVRRSWAGRPVFRTREQVHLGSYFLALRPAVLFDEGFRRRLDAVVPQDDHELLVQKYEYGTTAYLIGRGFAWDTWLPELRPNHPVYGPGAFDLLAEGFPLFKRRFLVANPYDTPGLADWKQRILAHAPDADVDAFERHLLRVADPADLADSFARGGDTPP